MATLKACCVYNVVICSVYDCVCEYIRMRVFPGSAGQVFCFSLNVMPGLKHSDPKTALANPGSKAFGGGQTTSASQGVRSFGREWRVKVNATGNYRAIAEQEGHLLDPTMVSDLFANR